MHLEEPPLRRGQLALERLDDLASRCLYMWIHQLGQLLRIALSGDQSLDDAASADPEDLADWTRDHQARNVEKLLDPQRVPADLAYELFASTC